ncbi:hypothetical protein JHD48_03100 [Sulfurimonas sp. SAG-AH-194-I05]|nr:hypothetical protein [Sulfurimonas sp. SAG-AH-194-I05]MDF1874720.1 hypothetical protein [Sulfurimonas sp. SAG-AH-194-I05]
MRLFLFLFLELTLFGKDVSIFDLSLHGKFCGKNTPYFLKQSKTNEADFLKNIEPIDIIDAACKEHDICYVTNGDFNEECDKELVRKARKIEIELEEKSCKMLTGAIIVFFETKNNNFIKVFESDYAIEKKVFEVSRISAKNIFDMASYSSDLALNYLYNKPVDYFFDYKNNKERFKEILQVFPARSYKCKTK